MNVGIALAFALTTSAARAEEEISTQERPSSTIEMSPVQLLQLAEQLERDDRQTDAEAALKALIQDNDVKIRSEARFRLAQMLAKKGEFLGAAGLYREILNEQPDAERVRVELAYVLIQAGDERSARKLLRQAQAGNLPPEVAMVISQFSSALRSTKPVGVSMEIAVAPDNNINRSTSAQMLDTIIAPIELSEDARQQSGIGAQISMQGYARAKLSPNTNLLVRASTLGRLYLAPEYNDIASSLLAGVETGNAEKKAVISIGRTWRYFGQQPYAMSNALSSTLAFGVNRQSQIEIDLNISDTHYRKNRLQNGVIAGVSIAYDHAMGAKSGFRLSGTVQRQSARDPGYATLSASVGATYYREIKNFTMSSELNFRWLAADKRLFIFPKTREESYMGVSVSAAVRHYKFLGFTPLVRINWEKNRSTVGLYDFSRFSSELGLSRLF